jgi:hypothetical protein
MELVICVGSDVAASRASFTGVFYLTRKSAGAGADTPPECASSGNDQAVFQVLLRFANPSDIVYPRSPDIAPRCTAHQSITIWAEKLDNERFECDPVAAMLINIVLHGAIQDR